MSIQVARLRRFVVPLISLGMPFATLACGRTSSEWACGPANIPVGAGQSLVSVGIAAVSTLPTHEEAALLVAGRRLQLIGDAVPRDWADDKVVVGPPWELQTNGQIVARVSEGGYFVGTLRLLHEAPTVILAQLGGCRPDMPRCDREFLLIALSADVKQPPMVVRLPDSPAEAPALLASCAGEAHVGVNGHIVSIAESKTEALRLSISDPVGNAPAQMASGGNSAAGGPPSTNGWPVTALGLFTTQVGDLAVVRYSMTIDSIASTTVANPRFNRTGAPSITCVAALPSAPRFGELAVTVDFRCTDPASSGPERFVFDEGQGTWIYLSESGNGRIPLHTFQESRSRLPDWALAEIRRSDGERASGIGGGGARAWAWLRKKAQEDEQLAEDGKRPSALESSSPANGCSQAKAADAVRSRAKRETNPYAELGRATTFVPDGACSWTVSGVIGWRDPMSNQPVMLRFAAAVSGDGGRYTVDLFQVTGGFP